MKLAALSDLHLGFRRYDATTKSGRIQREQDVSDAWAHAVDGIIAAGVELALVAGDWFETGRPSVAALTDAVRGVQRLVKARIPVLGVSGNHDEKGCGRGEHSTGSPLDLLTLAGAKIARRTERVSLPHLNCHVLLVPDADVMRTALEPGEQSGTHLLCAHGKFNASLYKLPEAECRNPAEISDRFSAALLGDFHCFSQVAPNAWYSGSLEYTSSNPWGELDQPKGWLLVDSETGTAELQPVPARRHLDLPAFSAMGMTGQEVTAQIVANLAAVEVKGAVVRQLVHDARRGLVATLDHKALKAARAGCLNFQLDTRAIERILAGGGQAIVPGALIPDDDDAPDWIDAMNAEDREPLPQDDDYSLHDAFQRGERPQELAA